MSSPSPPTSPQSHTARKVVVLGARPMLVFHCLGSATRTISHPWTLEARHWCSMQALRILPTPAPQVYCPSSTLTPSTSVDRLYVLWFIFLLFFIFFRLISPSSSWRGRGSERQSSGRFFCGFLFFLGHHKLAKKGDKKWRARAPGEEEQVAAQGWVLYPTVATKNDTILEQL